MCHCFFQTSKLDETKGVGVGSSDIGGGGGGGELALSTSCLDVRFIRRHQHHPHQHPQQRCCTSELSVADPMLQLDNDNLGSGEFKRKSGVFHLPSESDHECEDETRTPLFSRKRESSV